MEKWNFQIAMIDMMKVYSFLHLPRLLIPRFLCCMLSPASIESFSYNQCPALQYGVDFESSRNRLFGVFGNVETLHPPLAPLICMVVENDPGIVTEPLEVHNGIQLLLTVIPSSVQEAGEESEYSFIMSLDRLSNFAEDLYLQALVPDPIPSKNSSSNTYQLRTATSTPFHDSAHPKWKIEERNSTNFALYNTNTWIIFHTGISQVAKMWMTQEFEISLQVFRGFGTDIPLSVHEIERSMTSTGKELQSGFQISR
ncbi:hypothetical protein VNO77_27374 [Canavalia gladiata]|uniref:Uncharacterized protein n=1 Tax=Canavalia gladiata TaxID=3824 RepID=A0AAN9KVN8_CANGL